VGGLGLAADGDGVVVRVFGRVGERDLAASGLDAEVREDLVFGDAGRTSFAVNGHLVTVVVQLANRRHLHPLCSLHSPSGAALCGPGSHSPSNQPNEGELNRNRDACQRHLPRFP
jgi:hypothetical protein